MPGILGFSGNILAFLGVLLVLVLAHELGHFITAKLAGVPVLEFGFGYPPRLFAIRYKGTDYSLNLLPLGGFVKLVGEEDPAQPGGLAGRSIGVRLMVLGAGSFMNAVLPVVLLTATFMAPRDTVVGPVRIEDVAAESPAALAGLQAGDVIRRINDREISSIREVGYNIQLNLGSQIEVAVTRDGQTRVATMVPRWNPPPGQGATGIVISMPEREAKTVALPLPQALGEGLRSSLDMLSLFKNGILSTFLARSGPAVTGPIGIAQVTGEVAQGGVLPLLEWMALLSMNLAVMNILPIPMLDGGRVFFVLLEWVRRGRRIPAEREGLVHLVGFVILMGLILIVSYYDIMRIVRGESILR